MTYLRGRSGGRLLFLSMLTAGWLFGAILSDTQALQRPPAASWKCLRGDGQPCGVQDLGNSFYRQILVLSTAYPGNASDRFWKDFGLLVERLGGRQAGNAWSVQKRDRILYVGYFTGGGALQSGAASFGARIIVDTTGTPTLALDNEAVFQFINGLQSGTPAIQPLAVTVLFQSGSGAAANASPPSFIGMSYGIAKLSSEDLKSAYTPAHELGHAALNFLDEYVESGLESVSIHRLDSLTPRLIFDSQTPPLPHDVYDYTLSEILAGNGPVNIALRSDVTTAPAPGAPPELFEVEGGLFFGKGTFHAVGKNLMNANRNQPGAGRDFAYDHSLAQQRHIAVVFGETAARANDRLKNAGPVSGWPNAGPSVDLLLYDAGKNNPWHATTQYQVQVGWYEENQWRVETYTVSPVRRTADLPITVKGPEENLLIAVACRAGMSLLSSRVSGHDICDRRYAADALTMQFILPYETITVPAPQPSTTYWWRFSTDNGTAHSGWTGWSSFYRSF